MELNFFHKKNRKSRKISLMWQDFFSFCSPPAYPNLISRQLFNSFFLIPELPRSLLLYGHYIIVDRLSSEMSIHIDIRINLLQLCCESVCLFLGYILPIVQADQF